VMALALALLLSRAGLLATASYIFVLQVLFLVPLTTDLSAWYAPKGLWWRWWSSAWPCTGSSYRSARSAWPCEGSLAMSDELTGPCQPPPAPGSRIAPGELLFGH